jgi:hypothetical protein
VRHWIESFRLEIAYRKKDGFTSEIKSCDCSSIKSICEVAAVTKDAAPRTKRGRNTRRPASGVLARRLVALEANDANYWSFADRDDRQFVHSFFQYPAMMVPRLQRQLLEECVRWDPKIKTVYDPFVGSGTVMTEAMMLGLDFVGGDINPLAALVCKAKAELFDSDLLTVELTRLLKAIDRDQSNKVEVDFTNLEKWFTPEVILGLSRIRRAILARRSQKVRRFWWVALAETVRLSSNSRTSTVKLHKRPDSEISTRPDACQLFSDVAHRNLSVLHEQQQLLRRKRLLSGSSFRGMVEINIGDVRDGGPRHTADVMVTSPPYGDNHTTVPYGQASFLPLQWIHRPDIARSISECCVESTHGLDTRSLGGSRTGALKEIESALDRSPHLRLAMDQLANVSRDCCVRIGSFYRDLDASLDPILDRVRPGGILIWTTGDRSVGGLQVPMSDILRDLLGRRTELVVRLEREIPQTRKRMPAKNSTTATMAAETILVVRKAMK